MKIAILYICTGNYHIFWQKFYNSAKNNLFPKSSKHFFVFSDADPSLFDAPDVTFTHQEKLGWPYDTLKRFHIFLRVEKQLRDFDYVFFFNANIVFHSEVSEKILPSKEEKLLVVQHPGYFDCKPYEFPYDKNPLSLACMPKGQGTIYVMGAANGGICHEYLDLVKDLAWAVDKDLERNVIALWHDESHLNKYILHRNYKLLSPSYCFPENSSIPYDNIITIVDKNNFGGHDFLRNAKGTLTPAPRLAFWARVRRKMRSLFKKLIKKY